jgi:hypothetical protein
MKRSICNNCLAATFSYFFGGIGTVMSQTMPLDVINLLGSGNASVTHTSLDIGSISDVFDGDTGTLARTLAINPMVVTLNFATAKNLINMSRD